MVIAGLLLVSMVDYMNWPDQGSILESTRRCGSDGCIESMTPMRR